MFWTSKRTRATASPRYGVLCLYGSGRVWWAGLLVWGKCIHWRWAVAVLLTISCQSKGRQTGRVSCQQEVSGIQWLCSSPPQMMMLPLRSFGVESCLWILENLKHFSSIWKHVKMDKGTFISPAPSSVPYVQGPGEVVLVPAHVESPHAQHGLLPFRCAALRGQRAAGLKQSLSCGYLVHNAWIRL